MDTKKAATKGLARVEQWTPPPPPLFDALGLKFDAFRLQGQAYSTNPALTAFLAQKGVADLGARVLPLEQSVVDVATSSAKGDGAKALAGLLVGALEQRLHGLKPPVVVVGTGAVGQAALQEARAKGFDATIVDAKGAAEALSSRPGAAFIDATGARPAGGKLPGVVVDIADVRGPDPTQPGHVMLSGDGRGASSSVRGAGVFPLPPDVQARMREAWSSIVRNMR
jgi:hypothetical protein